MYGISFNRSSLAYVISSTLATSEVRNSVGVSPNPAVRFWTIKSGSAIESVQIYDVTGKLVVSKIGGENEVAIDASSLQHGMYFAKVKLGGEMQTVKLIKQ